MKLTILPRLLGAATAAYGAVVVARPPVFLRPTGLSADDNPSFGIATATRAVGARDVVSGLAMALAPTASGLRMAVAVRVACDVADTVLFATALRGRPEQAKAVGVAAGWGVLCALSALTVPDD